MNPELEEAKKEEDQLMEDVASFRHDPLGFIRFAYPWGEPGTELETKEIDDWQVDIAGEIGKQLRAGLTKQKDGSMLYTGEPIRIAVASGHGIGKSALICMLLDWGMSTFENTRGVVTAGTKTQLDTKTWPELAKWRSMSITEPWFKFEATSLAVRSNDPMQKKAWRIDAVPWSKQNSEAFQGLHNQRKRIIIIYDEGSQIEDIIHEATDGALTDEDTEIIWIMFSNPTRNMGRFREAFRKFRHRWTTRQIDSRTCAMTNKKLIQQWIDDHGIDSDFVKVRVLGQFPDTSERQYIPTSVVEAAMGRHVKKHQYNFAPKILTLDNAWDGGDEIVFGLRQGLVFQILKTLSKNDNDDEIAGFLMEFEDQHQADAVFIDFGMGTGPYSVGKSVGRSWNLIKFGEGSTDPECLNMRAKMWKDTKNWLKAGGCIPDDQVLKDDLIGPEYTIRTRDSVLVLESKKDMKARGLPSPNRADALVLSFAKPVKKKDRQQQRGKAEFGTPSNIDILDT